MHLAQTFLSSTGLWETLASSPLVLLGSSLSVSLAALFAARALRMDRLAHTLLVGRMPRSEMITRLAELAELSEKNDSRGMRRVADRCRWQLFRRGADMLARGAEPPEIARRLEQAEERVFRRRVELLGRLSSMSAGLLVLPVALLVLYCTTGFGLWERLETLIAGIAFVSAVSLLTFSSVARWVCDHERRHQAVHTMETEALIFALAAIRGGAPSQDVREMTNLMLGTERPEKPLRRAA